MSSFPTPRPSPLELSSVIARLRAEHLLVSAPAAALRVTGIADDSRRVAPGDLFCAWVGTSVDSHAFVAAAARAGAVAALVEHPVPEADIPQVVVRDGRRAAAAAAMAVLGDPAARLRLVGVTGTNGKSTTVWMLRHLLSARYTTASIGTLGVRLADGSLLPGSENLTTPGPVDLARMLRGLVDAGVEAVAMEVSSHALDQGRVSALRFDAGVFTNLTRDHLDYHGTLDAYLTAKLGLIDLLKPGAVAVANADDPAWRDVPARAPRSLTFGRTPGADVAATRVAMSAQGARFRLVAFEGAADARMPLVGDFNVDNALAAAAAALALGLSLEEIVARLATMPQVPGRLEKVTDEPCPVFADYAHTPDALQRALAALRPLAHGRLIVVFGAGGDRDRGKRPLMAAAAETGADVVVVTSDNPRTEAPDAIVDEIVAGFRGRDWIRITDRREAIGRALSLARPGDVLLLAGKGHETYQVVGTEKRHLDEREVVAEWRAAHAGVRA
jgi:UDP-N-acetylmuramoyl-L-alanyl-D-glutamate--2,6-diaminopimelate ligase